MNHFFFLFVIDTVHFCCFFCISLLDSLYLNTISSSHQNSCSTIALWLYRCYQCYQVVTYLTVKSIRLVQYIQNFGHTTTDSALFCQWGESMKTKLLWGLPKFPCVYIWFFTVCVNRTWVFFFCFFLQSCSLRLCVCWNNGVEFVKLY